MTSAFLWGMGRLSLAAAFVFAALATMTPWALLGFLPAAGFGVFCLVRQPSQRRRELGEEALRSAAEWDREHRSPGSPSHPGETRR